MQCNAVYLCNVFRFLYSSHCILAMMETKKKEKKKKKKKESSVDAMVMILGYTKRTSQGEVLKHKQSFYEKGMFAKDAYRCCFGW